MTNLIVHCVGFTFSNLSNEEFMSALYLNTYCYMLCVLCVYMYQRGDGALRRLPGGQIVKSQLSPSTMWVLESCQAVRLGGKHLYSLSHPTHQSKPYVMLKVVVKCNF